MSRFNVIKSSKFEVLTNEDMINIKGGTTICLNCMKRTKKRPWSLVLPGPEFKEKEIQIDPVDPVDPVDPEDFE